MTDREDRIARRLALVLAGLDDKKWTRLPQMEREMALLIQEASITGAAGLTQRPIWASWWASANPWQPLFLAKQVRPLNQANRAVALSGLALRLDKRKLSDPIPEDGGVLNRVVGTQWEEGVSFALGQLEKCPPEEIRALLHGALSHALRLRKAKSLQWLVQWASKNDIVLDEPFSGRDLASVWAFWFRKQLVKADDELLGQSLRVLGINSHSPQAQVAWNQWAQQDSDRECPTAIAAWCHLHPNAWEEMHRKALDSQSGVKGAWLAACSRAEAFGVDDILWRQAVVAPSTPQWMKTPWGPSGESPLALWISEQVEHPSSSRPRFPGADLVSGALRALGAPEPGSKQEREMGGPSLIALIPAYLLDHTWFSENPQWALPHPKTGRTPLFNAASWSKAKSYVQCGLSWFHEDANGDNAFASFLSSSDAREVSYRIKSTKEVVSMWENGSLPVVGIAKGRTIAGSVSDLHKKALFSGYTSARMTFTAPLDPLETQQVVHRGEMGFAVEWKDSAIASGKWSSSHETAFWRGAVLHGDASEYGSNAVEDPGNPSWVLALTEDIHDHNRIRMLQEIHSLGFAGIDATHALWDTPKPSLEWVGLVCNVDASSDRRFLTPLNASAQWWADRIEQWTENFVLANSPDEDASFLRRAIDLGMPLEGQVLQTIEQNPKTLRAARTDPELIAALDHAALGQSTPTPTAARRSNRL